MEMNNGRLAMIGIVPLRERGRSCRCRQASYSGDPMGPFSEASPAPLRR